jgi:hypothetical protein
MTSTASRFPRYYFGALACRSELLAWMQARGLLEDATSSASSSQSNAEASTTSRHPGGDQTEQASHTPHSRL